MTQGEIRASLIDQLEGRGKKTAYTESLVDDYMQHYKISRQLIKDIRKRGVKVEKTDTRGNKQIVDNDSIKSLQNEQGTMLKLLQTLGLHEPVKRGSNNDYL